MNKLLQPILDEVCPLLDKDFDPPTLDEWSEMPLWLCLGIYFAVRLWKAFSNFWGKTVSWLRRIVHGDRHQPGNAKLSLQ